MALAAMKIGAHAYIMKDNLKRLVPAIERELREADMRRFHRIAEATIHHLAYHDCLTGLVNRNEFDRCLNAALDSAKADDFTHALLYLDIDQFKVINDTCGHQAVAEYVENEEMLALLQNVGVDFAQVYCIERPHLVNQTISAWQ